MTSEIVREQKPTFPKSVQPGIPRIKPPKFGWSTYKLGDLIEPVQRPIKLNDTETYNLVTVKRSRGGVESRGKLLGSQISVKTQFKLQAADFLISKRQIVHGACGIVPDAQHDAIVSNEYSILRCKPSLNLNFLNYLSHTIYFQQICFHSSIGVHIEKMIFKLDEWLKWPINIPSLPEQQKIADFLSSVDAKIDAVNRKLDAFKRYKKGLIQQIFSQKIRFKQDDGSDFPEWEEMPLGQAVIRGTCDKERYNRPNIWVIDLEHLESETGHIISKSTSENSLSQKNVFSSGDILFGKLRPYLKKFARPDFDGVCSSEIWVLSGVKVLNAYLLYIVQTSYFNQLANVSSGSKMPRSDWETIADSDFSIPSLPEQEKIADFLASFDDKIYAIKTQVEKLEAFKKGLLQQMFV